MRWARFVVVGFAVSAMSCLAPTEIMLVIGTDVACAVVAQNGIAIAVGEPGDEDSGIATTTKLCSSDGGIGTLVLLPHTSLDQPIGIRVTLGIDASADNCGPNFAGCIVARRSLRFDPHTPLTLPIDLDQACIGVPCTPNSTCVSGTCIDAGVECDGASCGLEDASVDAGIDAGACQVVNDVPVNTDTGPAPARVALSSDGWAVAYQTKPFGVELSDVHLFGGTLDISQPVTLVSTNNAALLGPLGGDGTSYAITYETSVTQTFALLAAPDGTPLTSLFDVSGHRPAHFGMLPLGQAAYATGLIGPPTDNAFVATFSPKTGDVGNNAGIAAGGLVEITLVRGSSTYYVTTADQGNTCSLYQCVYQTTFTCSPLTNIPSCMGARVAERLGAVAHVVESTSATLTVDDIYGLAAPVLGTAFQMIATRDAFQIVYVTTGGGIIVATYKGNAPPMIQQLTTAGSVVGIDVVADGPNAPGFAIAYTVTNAVQTSSVHFMHRCQ